MRIEKFVIVHRSTKFYAGSGCQILTKWRTTKNNENKLLSWITAIMKKTKVMIK